ncbi:hypothetical protein D3C76_1853660 [compost metagenome]
MPEGLINVTQALPSKIFLLPDSISACRFARLMSMLITPSVVPFSMMGSETVDISVPS